MMLFDSYPTHMMTSKVYQLGCNLHCYEVQMRKYYLDERETVHLSQQSSQTRARQACVANVVGWLYLEVYL